MATRKPATAAQPSGKPCHSGSVVLPSQQDHPIKDRKHRQCNQTHTAGRFAEGLPTTLRVNWGPSPPKQARDDPNQYDTHQLNLVRSHTDTTAGIRTNPPHLSLPPAVDGNKPASYVNRDTRPPAARHRTLHATPNLGRDALVAKSVHPALSAATKSQRQLLPPPCSGCFARRQKLHTS